MDEIVIRPATLNDAAAIARLVGQWHIRQDLLSENAVDRIVFLSVIDASECD